MKSRESNDFSFEGVARAARRDALRLTPAQRVARSIELQQLANRFKAAGQRASPPVAVLLRSGSDEEGS